MTEKLVGLEDLPNNLGIKLEDNFRKEIFDRTVSIVGNVKKLSKLFKCDRTAIWQWKTGKILIKIVQLKKLSNLTKISLEEIESKIIGIRCKRIDNKDFIKIKFPVFSSSELASVIGHAIGDGNVSKRQFSFFNQRRELVDELIDNVRIAFNTDVIPKEFEKEDGWEIEFPTNISLLVNLSGAPLGKKVFTKFDIPNWIKEGNDETKSAFLRALFDDEGWIKIKFIKPSSSTQRMIGINMSKNEKFIDSHKQFFESIRKLLQEFGMQSSNVTKMGKTKNGVSLGIIISNITNLNIFLEKIGFTNVQKEQKLIKCLNDSIRFRELFGIIKH